MHEAVDDPLTWVVCDRCVCKDMGGLCASDTMGDTVECEIRADVSAQRLDCRLVLKDDWIGGFSALSFIAGFIFLFLCYFIVVTAHIGSMLKRCHKACPRLKDMCISFITCKPVIVLVSCAWVEPFCKQVFDFDVRLACMELGRCLYPPWLRSLVDRCMGRAPVFVPGKQEEKTSRNQEMPDLSVYTLQAAPTKYSGAV